MNTAAAGKKMKRKWHHVANAHGQTTEALKTPQNVYIYLTGIA